jgi:hypothetical protein
MALLVTSEPLDVQTEQTARGKLQTQRQHHTQIPSEQAMNPYLPLGELFMIAVEIPLFLP